MKTITNFFLYFFIFTSTVSAADSNMEHRKRVNVFRENLDAAIMVINKTQDQEAREIFSFFVKRAAPVGIVDGKLVTLIDLEKGHHKKDEILFVAILFKEDATRKDDLGTLYRNVFLANEAIEAAYLKPEIACVPDFMVLRGESKSSRYYRGLIFLHEIKHYFMHKNKQPVIKSDYPSEKEAYEFQSRLLAKIGGTDFVKIANDYADKLIKEIENTTPPPEIPKMYFLAPYYEIDLSKFFGGNLSDNKSVQDINFSVLVTFMVNDKILKKFGLEEKEIALRQAAAIAQRIKNHGIGNIMVIE